MRWVAILVIVLFVLAGIGFGALNPALVGYDFGFGSIHVPKGAALLAAVVVGWLLGGLVAWAGTGAAHRKKITRKRLETKQPKAP